MTDQEILDSLSRILKENDLYRDNPDAKILQVWQERQGSVNASIQIDVETIDLWELINEAKPTWLFIGEDRKFLVSSAEVRTIYQAQIKY